MPAHRDVAAFGSRAHGYEAGWLGRLHHEIADAAAELALRCVAVPGRVLDIGCGTGYLLCQLASQCTAATVLAGIDPASAMLDVAAAASNDSRIIMAAAVAEQLPFRSGMFDLVVSTTSFDHWVSQRAGLGAARYGHAIRDKWDGSAAARKRTFRMC